MANKVLLKKSSVTSKVPLTTDLDYGELALNYADEKLYFKNASNAIKSFNVTPSTLTIGTGLSGTSYNGSSAVTIAIDSTVATLTGSQTLTNKTLSSPIVSGGTIDNTVIGGTTPAAITGTTLTSTTGDISSAGALISTASSGDEGGEIRLAKAATNTTLNTSITIDVYQNKLRIFETGGTNRGAYIDLTTAGSGVGSNLLTGGGGGASSMNIAGDTGTDTISFSSETLTFVGGTGITSAVTSNTVTFDIDSTVATLTGSQTLTNKTIAAGSNTITGLTNSNLSGSAGITNANLANSSVTIGSTSVSLGATATTIVGLTSITSTSFVGALTGNADTVTNGVYTSGSYSDPTWLTISKSKVGLGNVENTALSTSTYYVGTTQNTYNRASAAQTLTGVSIDGNAGTVTNGVYTSGSYSDPTWITSLSGTKLTGTVVATNGVVTTGSYSDPTWLTISKSKVGLGNVENTALSTWAGSTNITTIGAATASSLTVTGDLTVNGTVTTINSTTVSVDDKNIELGSVASPTDTTANGGGITLRGTSDKTFNWVSGTTAWTSSEHLNLLIGKAYYINGVSVLNSTTLGSGITGSSLTSVGTITTGVWNGSAIQNIYLQNSTISGVSLGQSLNALTIGTGLSGTSYNGSSAVTIALATGYGDTQNPYASKTANYVLAAPNGSAGAPTFRALVAADIPTLNQNTTGSAGSVANSLTAGTGLSGSTYNGSAAVTWNLANTAVTAGSYTAANITVDAQGRITAASNGSTSTWLFKTANYTASDGDRIIADTSVAGTFTITLPASPVLGTQITLADGNSWANANLIVARNGKTIKGLAENLTVDIAGIKVDLLYSGSTWLVYAFAAPTLTTDTAAEAIILGGSSVGLWS